MRLEGQFDVFHRSTYFVDIVAEVSDVAEHRQLENFPDGLLFVVHVTYGRQSM
jgi:hypothetical protein